MIDFPTTTATGSSATAIAGGWSVTAPPIYRPVTAAEVKAHCRLASSASDTQLELMIDAATDYAEAAMSICLAARTITASFALGQPLTIPRGPIISIASVVDANGTAPYSLAQSGHRTTLVGSVSLVAPITVTYRAGFTGPGPTFTEDATAIPAMIRQCILMHVGTLYEARESTTDKQRTAVPHSLDDFYRRQSRGIGVG